MKVFVIVCVAIIEAGFGLSTVTKEDLKVASDNSRKLANDLAQILDTIRADLGQAGENIATGVSNDDDADKVENILLQFQIHKLEQELLKLEQAQRLQNKTENEIPQVVQEARQPKKLRLSDNRLKYRQMLELFYHGDNFDFDISYRLK